MEYKTEEFIERIYEKIINKKLQFFVSYPIIKAKAKNYVRESQIRVILNPILDRLSFNFRTKENIEQKLKLIILKLLSEFSTSLGYAGGNIINLLCQLKVKLTGYDFSHLAICQAYLWDIHTGCCVRTLQGHTSRVFSVAFAPLGNNQMLASGDSDHAIKLSDINTGECLKSLPGHTDSIWSVAFSPDGQTIASSSGDSTDKLWNVSTG